MSEEGLYSIAEIAITLAGFTGLLGLFRSTQNSVQGELRRIFYIFLMCFAVIIGAFLPGVIATFDPGSERGWQVSTAFLGCVAFLVGVWALIQFRTGSIRLSLPIASHSMAIVSLLVGMLLLAASLGIAAGPVKGYLLIGLLWLLMYSGYIFVTTLIWGTGDQDDPEREENHVAES